MITDELAALVHAALETAVSEGVIAAPELPSPNFERPRQEAHGDWSTNVALAIKGSGSPRDTANAIKERIPASDLVERVEVAGPGFLNFYLSQGWLHDVVRRALDPTTPFGHTNEGEGKKVNVEYVSSNPTGPINVVSGRHAAVGDAVANLLAATGYEVTREFYINDAGRQMSLFALSLRARYLQQLGRDAKVPEDGYQGDYLVEFAARLAGEVGDKYVDLPDDEVERTFLAWGLPRMLESMKESLERFGTTYDVWFSELKLRDAGKLDEAVAALGAKDLTYQKDGAVWFRSSDFGDDKDRVLVRSNGEPTYLAGDIPYLIDKFERGFDRLIYVWGADHHGSVARLRGAGQALGFDPDRVEMLLLQIVTLVRGGDAVKASKRAGVLVPLDELVDEVGKDAARYTFLTRSFEAPLEFDIELAKEQAPENPVYYVQYAHARICSIVRKAASEGIEVRDGAALELLTDPSEGALMRKLASYEEVIPDAARLRAPQRVTRYLGELASAFSAFYRDAKVVSEDADLTNARLTLCLAVRSVLADGLTLLGVDAPERM
ncbi:MAG: arginyl-tRNA synthetase [Actinomycetota bacterium]|nr:arginyl-tRNA synthetase [Actinomycetota bacterium]